MSKGKATRGGKQIVLPTRMFLFKAAKEAGKIQVYVRVRPFTEREKEKRETNAIEIHQEHSLIRVLDPRSRTNYFFDGVFSPEATNQELYLKVGKPLVYAALNGYKGTLLTYGQTGTGKTFTLLSDDGITTRVVQHCFEKIDSDEIHNYKVMCSFLQVYQEKVYDLLNPRFIVDLPVREHPKKGVYVANLTQHEVKSAGDVFALLEIGKQHLVIAETKMVRHSSRSHSIMQLIIERRLKAHIANEKPPSQSEASVSHEAVQESIMAVDETINNLIKELKQERKGHHKHERECLKELMEKELNNGNNFEGDLILKGKINLCDLAGSERLTKTKAEGVRLTEAKYLNTSLLELGNVIHALARGHKRHVPYRNSTLTRLLQDCLGDNGKTNFVICIAPSLSEVNETKCSLNFGLRAMKITNVARLNVEVDYKVLAERLAKKLEDHDIKYKFEKLEYLREIQRLKSAISCYQESENFAGKDHEKLVSVIANLSKSVQREKEEKNNLQTELVCLKRQVSQPIGTSAPDVEAVLLAELMSMELLANLQTPDVTKSIISDRSLPAKVKSHLALADTQEALLNNAGCFLQLLDLHLESGQEGDGRKLAASDTKDYVQFNFSKAGSVELFSKDCSIKISPRGAPQEPCLSLPMCSPTSEEATTGLGGGVRRMLGKLIGRDTKDRTLVSPDAQPNICACPNTQDSESGSDVKARVHNKEEAMIKTKALLKQLTSSKEKVEQQVLSLMSSLFEEQIVKSEGRSPQWNELGRKLNRLITFRRNNMSGLGDTDLWANSEDLNSILENCLRCVIIDKALLACLLVIELLDLRQAYGILGNKREFPGALNAGGGNVFVADKISAPENLPSPNKSRDEESDVKGNKKPTSPNGKKVASSSQEIRKNSPKGSVSPRREKLKNLKHTKTDLEKEITEMHEDTTKLENELFSTMEEKAKVEEELFGMKNHVTKLRSELFHLKLEKCNLEKDVKKSKSQENLQQYADSDEGKLNFESPKEALRGYPELSDVMEVSHESNDSENSSQMSDGNDTREAFLKTCMESISKIYTLMPKPDEPIESEDELSDDQEPTLSDANIDDSDEEIIITKLARSLRSPCASPAKEKTFEASSPNKSSKKETFISFGQQDKGNDNSEDLENKSKDALIKQIQELKKKLHKVEQELADAQETSDDLEEELDHKKGQLAEAQETITNLENQVVEEKETCEQVRQQYFNVKSQNEILEEKIKALRSELERVLVRENNALSGFTKPTENSRKDNPPPSPTKTSTKSPFKSPGKTKVSKIDLRGPPPKQLTSNEMEVVSLIEENAELKVKLGNTTQERSRLEKSQKLAEEKSSKMKAALQASEDACRRLKDELALLSKEKVKLVDEVTHLRNNNSNITEELERYREKSMRLEKDIEAISYMSTRFEKDNKMLEIEISKMESELSSLKRKHEVTSQECNRLKQERVQVDKDSEKALLELETLKKEKSQLLEERVSNEKENQRRHKEFKSKEERFYELETDVSEQKRLNSNLHKELAGMAEYQEALENEYSKAKNEEDRLKQELAKISSRVIEAETKLAQNTHNEGAVVNQREPSLSFGQEFHPARNSYKPELNKGGKPFTGTPSKKFYTITHTSEDEIGDTSSSIAESPADETKQVEHENQLLKLENSYLQQQLAESEHVLAMYRQDLESAHDLIDKLQAETKAFTVVTKNEIAEEDCKTPSDKDVTIKEIGDCSDSASDEYKLLEEKHAELTREYELLRQQYQEALTHKEKVEDDMTKESTNLNEGLRDEEKNKKQVSGLKQDTSRLQQQIKELEAENRKMKITAKELSQNEKGKNALLMSLEDSKRVITTLEETINTLESENKALKETLDARATYQDSKTVRQRSLDEQVTRLKEEHEALRVETLKSTVGGQPEQLQQTTEKHDRGKMADNSEIKVQELEEDLLKVTSEKIQLEFELRSANNDCERLRSDLLHSESERKLLISQLDDSIEKATNLEIRLMEMRCSCETIKDEINNLKNEKRQESFHLHEASVSKEILEKRLEDALKENNVLHHELAIMREERNETIQKSAKLEKEKDKLTKEIDNVKTQIRKLELEFEGTKLGNDEAIENEQSEVSEETMEQEESQLEQLKEHERLHREDQTQLTILRQEIERVTAEHKQMETELEKIKGDKESLERQIENMKEPTMENCCQSFEKGEEEIIDDQNERRPECERTTFDTLEIEKHMKILEKEKGLLEKELTRVQEECNNLKEKIEVIKQTPENVEMADEKRKELQEKQQQVEKELQDLRELNQKLESECDDSHKLIQQLQIKTKTLDSLQKELHCFHAENDRLTHEVQIIHKTSKAMTDHQCSKESLETENASLKQELESLQDHNRKLQMQAKDLSKDLLAVRGQNENVTSTKKRNLTLQSELEKFQKMQQHLENELASSKEKIKEIESANESLKKENKAVKGRIKSLEQRNEELRRKDDKKKVSTAENKSKTKSKHTVLKEGKDASAVECKNDDGHEKDLKGKFKQLEQEKDHLEEQLSKLKEKVNSQCAAVPLTSGVTTATQTAEPSTKNQAVEKLENTLTTISLGNSDREKNVEPESEKESPLLTKAMTTGFSLMAKEKLLLEKTTSYFARAQMQLEQSFAKALRENAVLKIKVDEAENVLEVLREKLHELEKNKSASLPVVDLKQNVLMSSDSESDFDEKVPAKGHRKEGSKDDQSVDLHATSAEELKHATGIDDEGCLFNHTQPKVDQQQTEKEQQVTQRRQDLTKRREDLGISNQTETKVQQSIERVDDGRQSSLTQSDVQRLREEKEQILKELEALKTQKEEIQNDLNQKKEDLRDSSETEKEIQQSTMTDDEGCLSNPTQTDVNQLRKEKEQLLKELEALNLQKEEIESALEEKKEDLRDPSETEREIQQSNMTCDKGCLSNPTQSDVVHLQKEKEQILKELEALKSQKEKIESDLKEKKEGLRKFSETKREVQQSNMTDDEGCLSNPTQSDIDQLQKEKEQILKELEVLKSQKEEIESDLKENENLRELSESKREVQQSNTTDDEGCLSNPVQSDLDQLQKENEKLLKELEALKSQKEEIEDKLKQEREDLRILDETNRLFDKHEQENALLKQERKSLLEELEVAKSQRNLTESELRHNKESFLKQEQEIKLLRSSYSQEKESLLKELENAKSDCRKAKEKLRELQQIEVDFQDIRKKGKEAENLIIELEKDLLSQTEMKNELRRELQTCKNKLEEIESLETQLRTCKKENEDLHTTNMQLMEEAKKWKDNNEVKNAKFQRQKTEKQRKNFLNVNPSMKRLQDQCIQTESVLDNRVGGQEEFLEDYTKQNNPPDSYTTDLCQVNSTEGVENLPNSSEVAIKLHETNKDVVDEPVALEATETAQTNHKYEDVEVLKTDSKVGTFGGVPIPIIVVSYVDDIETIKNDKAASLSLCIEGFDSDSPNDQSTPDEEKGQLKPSLHKEDTNEMQVEPLSDSSKLSEQKDERSWEINLHRTADGSERGPQMYQEQLENQSAQETAGGKPTLEAENNIHDLDQQHEGGEALRNVGGPKEVSKTDKETHSNGTENDASKSRRELEWTICSLKSELLQRSEDNEKNQHEIGLLVEEQLSLKREIGSLLNECESLRAKVAVLQTQNEAVLKEQILNDEENEDLQQNLQDLIQERNSIEESKRNLESQKARLEIELSDAIETREAMERELLRIRTEGTDVSKHRLEGQFHDISERYTKLETVLSCVLDENSKMTAELSALQAENSMLKSFKIMEITDNCTQFSPRTTEDESDGEGIQSVRRTKSGIKGALLTSNGNSTSRHRLSLGNDLTNLPLDTSPSSSEHQGKGDSSLTPSQAQDDEGTTTDEIPGTPTISYPTTDLPAEPVKTRFDEEAQSVKRDRVSANATNDNRLAKTRYEENRVGTLSSTTASLAYKVHRKQERNTARDNFNGHQKYDASEDAAKRDSDDHDSSMEAHTSSSLASVTDLDISISSDQISSEDSSVVGPEIRVLQRMQKELAETKCSNVLVKNELAIIRKHNSDLQNQVQKLLSRNNHLKTKMCDRTLSVKRMEKEMLSIKDENNRLQQQTLVLQEEMARFEKEKAKYERNLSSTKSENKRLKSDLSNIKAESYRTMKELVNLQSENRRLQLEIEKLREEARSFKGVFSDESVSQELSSWGSMSHGDFRSTSRRSLQERPTKLEPMYLQQRAASELAFSQHQRLLERPETPELSPLNLSKELQEQHADGSDCATRLPASADTISVNDTGGSRTPGEPVSRRIRPLSYTSEPSIASEPSDRDANGHSSDKVEEHDHDQDEEGERGKNKKKIKTILRRLQHRKNSKSSK